MKTICFCFLIAIAISGAKGFQIQSQQSVEYDEIIGDPPVCNKTNFVFYDLVDFYQNSHEFPLALKAIENSFRYNSIQSFEWMLNETTKFTIQTQQLNLSQISAKRRVKFVPLQKVVLLEGEFFEATVQFDWYISKNYSRITNGTGTAKGMSKEIAYSVNFVKVGRQCDYEFDSITAPSIPTLNITALIVKDGQPLTEEENFIFNFLINTGSPDVPSLRLRAQDFIADSINQAIGQSVGRDHHDYFWSYRYDYQSSKKIEMIFSKYRSVNCYVDQIGRNYNSFESYSQYDQTQICGPSILDAPFNTDLYGLSQEFVSYTLFLNTLISGSGILDSNLTRQNWGTRSFKFTTAELALALSNVSANFDPLEQASGFCKSDDTSTYQITKASNRSIYLSFNTSCLLKIQEKMLIAFDLSLKFEAGGIPAKNYTNFQLLSVSFQSNYNDTFGFKLENKSKADEYVKNSLERMYEQKLIGSGWPLFNERQNPDFLALDDSFMVYQRPAKVRADQIDKTEQIHLS